MNTVGLSFDRNRSQYIQYCFGVYDESFSLRNATYGI